jgi:hypothetical protein
MSGILIRIAFSATDTTPSVVVRVVSSDALAGYPTATTRSPSLMSLCRASGKLSMPEVSSTFSSARSSHGAAE